jgi:spermidine synthase
VSGGGARLHCVHEHEHGAHHRVMPASRRRLPGRRVAAAFAALILIALVAWLVTSVAGRTVFRGESTFGAVRVVERWDGVRTLYIGAGRAQQSAVVPGRPLDLQLEYTRTAAIGLALVPGGARILYVGLGGGAMPMHTRQVLPGADIDVVEIDPLVVAVAHEWFGFMSDERLRIHTADGRAFIEAAPPDRWDLVVLDAFSDDVIPIPLATREFLETLRSRLATGGVVVGNLWTSAPLYDAMLATYQAVFADVVLVRVARRNQVIVVAHTGATPLTRGNLLAAAEALAARTELGFDLPPRVSRGYERPGRVAAPVLRD